MPLIRLDRFISERGELTRSRIKELAAKGQIRVNGAVVRKSDTKIDPDADADEVQGSRIAAQRYKYVLLNKPAGYVSSTEENDGPTVMELLPPEQRAKNMFPAGRLDKDSLGALLLTDDGELAHRMLSPRNHIPKIYIVKLADSFQSKYVDLFAKGITLSDGYQCLPAKVKNVESSEKLAFIELCEGKYHQVKRMFAAVENHVEVLMRVSVGGLILPEKLAQGQSMELLHKDVENLFTPPDFDAFCREFSGVFSAFLIKI